MHDDDDNDDDDQYQSIRLNAELLDKLQIVSLKSG